MLPEWLGFLRWENWGALLKMGPGWIALLSGLFGAVITAFFNYVINIKLAKREQERKEQRVAYVYLVKISQLLSFESSTRQYFADSPKLKDMVQKNREEFSKPSFPFTFCYIIADLLKTNTEYGDKIKEYTPFFEMVKQSFDQTLNNFKIPAELLAQFPRDANRHYEQFVNSILGINNLLDNWIYWLKTGDTKLVNGTILYSHYVSGKIFIDSSHNFYDAIKTKAGVTNKEAEELLAKQKKESDQIFKALLFADILMDRLSDIFTKRKKIDEKPDEKEKLINTKEPSPVSLSKTPRAEG